MNCEGERERQRKKKRERERDRPGILETYTALRKNGPFGGTLNKHKGAGAPLRGLLPHADPVYVLRTGSVSCPGAKHLSLR